MLTGWLSKKLSMALQNPRQTTSETLCATLLLVTYEKFVAVGDVSSSKHAAGVGLLFVTGSPPACIGLEAAMLLACRRGLLVVIVLLQNSRISLLTLASLQVIEAMRNGEACFFERDDWEIHSLDRGSKYPPFIAKVLQTYHEIMNHFAIARRYRNEAS